MFNPEALKALVNASIGSREHQGYNMTSVKKMIQNIDEASCQEWLQAYEMIGRAPKAEGYQYKEPDELEKIKELRPGGPRHMSYNLTDLELKDKVHGAFLGRICGVILGRPVEGWHQRDIEEYLKGAGCYPLDNYMPRSSIVNGAAKKVPYQCLRSTREYVKYAEPDDDINYVLLALRLVEKLGINFTMLDVGYNWLDNLEANWTWGPERTAYLNLARYTETWPRYIDIDGQKLWEVSHYLNDYCEYIGALIRGDLFGYIAAGLPELAAGLAYRDASFTHVRNGIYGEMFASSMISAAFCTDDITEAIMIGMSEIPANCRLSEAIKNTIYWYDNYKDWYLVYKKIEENYNHYGTGHTINNAAIIVNSLLSCNGDFEKGICYTVMQGQDTDCTAATVGSVLGALHGAAILPEKFVKPLNDTVMSTIVGESKNKISEVAERIFNIGRMVTKCQRKITYLYSEPV